MVLRWKQRDESKFNSRTVLLIRQLIKGRLARNIKKRATYRNNNVNGTYVYTHTKYHLYNNFCGSYTCTHCTLTFVLLTVQDKLCLYKELEPKIEVMNEYIQLCEEMAKTDTPGYDHTHVNFLKTLGKISSDFTEKHRRWGNIITTNTV